MMGRRGPAATPTRILKLRGSNKIYNRKHEPQPERTKPPCPKWLDDDARNCWRRLADKLDAAGILTVIDGNALARYCHLWARWRRAEDFIKEKGDMYPLKDADGSVRYWQPWPQLSIAHKLAQQLTRLEQEFGLTPASRPRISVIPPATQSGLARFFRMPGDDEERFFGTS